MRYPQRTWLTGQAPPSPIQGLWWHPCGSANPEPMTADRLRTVPAAVQFAPSMFQAGGTWVDTEVQVCTSSPNVLVTSRNPGDLPAFCKQLVGEFQRS
jgi:putative intracellular protease/amidase